MRLKYVSKKTNKKVVTSSKVIHIVTENGLRFSLEDSPHGVYFRGQNPDKSQLRIRPDAPSSFTIEPISYTVQTVEGLHELEKMRKEKENQEDRLRQENEGKRKKRKGKTKKNKGSGKERGRESKTAGVRDWLFDRED